MLPSRPPRSVGPRLQPGGNRTYGIWVQSGHADLLNLEVTNSFVGPAADASSSVGQSLPRPTPRASATRLM